MPFDVVEGEVGGAVVVVVGIEKEKLFSALFLLEHKVAF